MAVGAFTGEVVGIDRLESHLIRLETGRGVGRAGEGVAQAALGGGELILAVEVAGHALEIGVAAGKGEILVIDLAAEERNDLAGDAGGLLSGLAGGGVWPAPARTRAGRPG